VFWGLRQVSDPGSHCTATVVWLIFVSPPISSLSVARARGLSVIDGANNRPALDAAMSVSFQSEAHWRRASEAAC
jgi:hypothetical protein